MPNDGNSARLRRAETCLRFAAALVELPDTLPPADVLPVVAAALRAASADLQAVAPELVGLNDRGETVPLACERLGVPDAVR